MGGLRLTSISGPAFGLELVVNVEQNKYITTGQTAAVSTRINKK